jgi:hypothetical protein
MMATYKVYRFHSAQREQDRAEFRQWFLRSFAPSELTANAQALGYTVTLMDVTARPQILMRPEVGGFPPPFCDVATEMWVEAPSIDGAVVRDAEAAAELRGKGILSAAYITLDQVRFDHHPKSPLGEATKGIKFLGLTRWKPGVSREDGRRMWAEHLNIVRRVHVRLSKYVQNWVEQTLVAGPERCDGIAQLHYEYLSDFEQHHYGSTENRDAIRADTARFNEGTVPLVGTEYILRQPSARI